MIQVQDLPFYNAILNSVTTVLLICGLLAILKGKKQCHQRFMISAFITSSLFLVGYLIHKIFHGPTPFQGQGPIRLVYFTILISHTILAVVNLPLILRTFYLSLRGRYDEHKRMARWTFPSWMYVSVTGVIVYLMLYQGWGR
jgi:putative membrane protein